MKIFLATGNKKKIDEIKDVLRDLDAEILSIKDGIEIPEVIEDGDSFEENSAKKALEIAKYLGMVTVADDSGLCVEALNGAPGIYSARFSGEDATDASNNKKLVELMSCETNKKAKFVAVITIAKPDGEYHCFRGELEGEIVDIARGTDGFGYDPHFYLKEYDKTLAEIPEIKREISHRAMALNKMKKEIKKILN